MSVQNQGSFLSRICLLGVLTALSGLLFAGCSARSENRSPSPVSSSATTREGIVRGPAEPSPQRIVSMSPSITETLFALGCGDRVVGVTEFCEYPPEVRTLPRVGGYLNPNLEAVLRLQPDLVIAPAGSENLPDKLKQLGLNVLTVDHRSLEGVFASLTILGEALHVPQQAEALAHTWQHRLDSLARRCRNRPRPRVLVVVDRPLDSPQLQNLCAVGNDGFLDKLIECAGGENVLRGAPVAFPILSAEGILRLDPEVIIDIQAGKAITDRERSDFLAAWQQVKHVAAVRHGRVYLLGNNIPVVPGPRMIELAEAFARCIHPNLLPESPPQATSLTDR